MNSIVNVKNVKYINYISQIFVKIINIFYDNSNLKLFKKTNKCSIILQTLKIIFY